MFWFCLAYLMMGLTAGLGVGFLIAMIGLRSGC